MAKSRDFDFVVGIEIHLSNNHYDKKPVCDICDKLVGIYPKTFKWSGFHDGCRCYTTTILCTKAEMREYFTTGVMRSENTVTKIPERTLSWVRDHNKEWKNFKWIKANGLNV
ncbi:MAG TPA: hypothetical protein VFC67_10975 [Prolixibacteraceae bacterium]|nr:hypothetical protein [Prolixibacteraceae bacterium]